MCYRGFCEYIDRKGGMKKTQSIQRIDSDGYGRLTVWDIFQKVYDFVRKDQVADSL